jgi:hypothetical protein
MPWTIPADERDYLRTLAERQATYAALPVMEERRRMWFDLNDGVPGAPCPVVIETWTFDRDFMPAGVYQCQSDAGRGVEAQLLRNLRQHELIGDDHVIPDRFYVGWHASVDSYPGVRITSESVPDSQGVNTGFKFHHPIKDLRTDLALLKPAVCSVDREGTDAYQGFVTDLLGDILPVERVSGCFMNAGLTGQVIALMGMEAFFLAMYDTPELLHELMAYLRDNCLRVMHWAEAEGLLIPNNGNQESFGSSYNYTRALPAAGYTGGPARLCDMWGSANSQETVGVSPDLFHEFCFPYYRDVCEPVGLLYWGCCEPAHPFWEDIRQFPHLRKVSISKWCDETLIANELRGTPIVFSRKPDPTFLSVDQSLNEEAWAAHIRASVQAAEGCQMEVIVRDVYTLHGDINNARRAVETARREVEKHVG